MAYKRPREDDMYSAFCLPRNVRARLASRHPQYRGEAPLCYRSILRKGTRRPVQDSILHKQHRVESSKENNPNIMRSESESESVSPQPEKERTTRIRFYQKVAVHRIPARHHYPDAMRRCIWSDMQEIREMARRNSIEFASDGFDWRRATEDDKMVVLPTGERIHPIWEQRRYFQPIQSAPIRRQASRINV
eukprot:Nitzschia sp. Nitz4//scaffold178_size73299//15400//15972//NITZ4_005695-RA/size73299-processed-gene-0.26-mRNA-1//-1//CDS//3329539110//7244//frame0